jgi:hypothetical protein
MDGQSHTQGPRVRLTVQSGSTLLDACRLLESPRRRDGCRVGGPGCIYRPPAALTLLKVGQNLGQTAPPVWVLGDLGWLGCRRNVGQARSAHGSSHGRRSQWPTHTALRSNHIKPTNHTHTERKRTVRALNPALWTTHTKTSQPQPPTHTRTKVALDAQSNHARTGTGYANLVPWISGSG